jgi:hypothetical protein
MSVMKIMNAVNIMNSSSSSSSILVFLFLLLLALPSSLNTVNSHQPTPTYPQHLASSPLVSGKYRSLLSHRIKLSPTQTGVFEVLHTNSINPHHASHRNSYDDIACVAVVFNTATKKVCVIKEYHPSSLTFKYGPVAGCVECYNAKHGDVPSSITTTTDSIVTAERLLKAVEMEVSEESGHDTNRDGVQVIPLFKNVNTGGVNIDKYTCTKVYPYLIITSHEPNAPCNRDIEEQSMEVDMLCVEELEERMENGECSIVGEWGFRRGLGELRRRGFVK